MGRGDKMMVDMSLNWTAVTLELNGCRFVQHMRANLVERSLYLCADEWEAYSASLQREVIVSRMLFGELVHTPNKNQTFYAPMDSVMYQLGVEGAGNVG